MIRPHPDVFGFSEIVTIEAVLERARFASPDDDWSVVAGGYSEATAVGNLASAQLKGKWPADLKFARQFKAESFTAVPQATAAGLERLLGSGLIEEIGKELASCWAHRDRRVRESARSCTRRSPGQGFALPLWQAGKRWQLR
jgi:hypothetical protein